MTRYVLGVLRAGADANKAALQEELWTNGAVDLQRLGWSKAQLELLEDLEEAEADDFNGWKDHFEPERD